MSSSGLIYAVIVGAWAAYLVPMWLRRQDELNEARPTERFSTAIRFLSGRAGMERRYAKDLRARSAEEDEPSAGPGADPDDVTDSVDVRAFAMPPGPSREEAAAARQEAAAARKEAARLEAVRKDAARREAARQEAGRLEAERDASARQEREASARQEREASARQEAARQERDATARQEAARHEAARVSRRGEVHADVRDGNSARTQDPAARIGAQGTAASARAEVPMSRRRSRRDGVPSDQPSAEAARRSGKQAPARGRPTAEAAARARRSKVLARRRRTTVILFLTFTCGAVVAAVGGLTFLWAPALPAVLLSSYIAYLRGQERRRFAYVMDRRQAEIAAQRLRARQPRRRPQPETSVVDEPEGEPVGVSTDPGLSALAADRRALVEQTDHAEWVDQQRERQQGPAQGESWDPVPVPLPTYVTAPVAPRATSGVDLGAPDAWSSARSSTAEPTASGTDPQVSPGHDADIDPGLDDDLEDGDERSDARRAASARRSRERGRTPLFDQYEEKGRPRAANE
ncbi:gephyrin-like molybdotransferase receptor GlpR [Streptomyces uncialis]|uniref:divisome protein SepX/GlpR n=1 Tax=Streptomyces uncialis TaxID=1048205 RepID=UPI0037983DC3